MPNCIFCQIVKAEIPSYKIYEDDKYLAFLDISQIVDGHTLLIPKNHVRWVWDIEDLGEFYGVVKKIVKHFQQVTGKEFVASVSLGMLVEHAHLHLLPSTKGSFGLVVKAWTEARETKKSEPEKLKELAEKFHL